MLFLMNNQNRMVKIHYINESILHILAIASQVSKIVKTDTDYGKNFYPVQSPVIRHYIIPSGASMVHKVEFFSTPCE